MPYAVLEKEIERLDETQQNTVVLFVRFLLSQKAAAATSVSADERPRKYLRALHTLGLFGYLRMPEAEKVEGQDNLFEIRIITDGNE